MDRRKANWFQSELNKIVGVEPNGIERFKLVWLPEYEVWDAFRGEMALHPFAKWDTKIDYKADPHTGLIRQVRTVIGVPRYALLGYTGQSTPAHLQRSGKEIDEIIPVVRPDGIIEYDIKETHYHASPKLPQYRIELIFAKHLNRAHPEDLYRPCCLHRAARFTDGFDRCFGFYVEPDESDIATVRREMKQYEELFRQHPSGTITQSQYSWIQRTEAEAKAAERAALIADQEYRKKHDGEALHKAMEYAITGARLTSLPALKKLKKRNKEKANVR